MMTLPLAVQLYSLRQEIEHDFETVIRQLAAAGYAGVETAGFTKHFTPERAAKLFKELGLQVAGAHLPLPIGESRHQVVETALALDCEWIVNGAIDRGHFQTLRGVYHACDLFNEANQTAAKYGLGFAIHNHWWEFEEVDGFYPYRVMLDRLDPSIGFELDAYWIRVGGHNPVEVIKEFGERAPFLHVKDGPAETPEQPMTAVGDGVMDYPSIIQAATPYAQWLIVELDRCATDMIEAVRKSFTYLSGEGLGHGR